MGQIQDVGRDSTSLEERQAIKEERLETESLLQREWANRIALPQLCIRQNIGGAFAFVSPCHNALQTASGILSKACLYVFAGKHAENIGASSKNCTYLLQCQAMHQAQDALYGSQGLRLPSICPVTLD